MAAKKVKKEKIYGTIEVTQSVYEVLHIFNIGLSELVENGNPSQDLHKAIVARFGDICKFQEFLGKIQHDNGWCKDPECVYKK